MFFRETSKYPFVSRTYKRFGRISVGRFFHQTIVEHHVYCRRSGTLYSNIEHRIHSTDPSTVNTVNIVGTRSKARFGFGSDCNNFPTIPRGMIPF